MKPAQAILLAITAAAALAACSGEPSRSATPALSASERATVDKAAAIANALRTTDDAAKVLSDNGVTEDQFDSMMYDIAADPDMSAAYNAKVGA